jgi:hypothetical protein
MEHRDAITYVENNPNADRLKLVGVFTSIFINLLIRRLLVT